jgi:TonB family protein
MKVWTLTANAIAGACAFATTCNVFAQAQADTTVQPSPAVDCRPRYPEAALRAHAQGVTGLAFHVDATGKLTQVEIVKSSGSTREHRLLDKTAASTLSLCPFKAAVDENGHLVESIVPVNCTWRLE